MLPYQIVCSDCGTSRTARKRALDGDVIPYNDTCSECDSQQFDLGRENEDG